MYQTIYDTPTQPTLSPLTTQQLIQEMKELGFTSEVTTSHHATFRAGERFVTFTLMNAEVTVRLGFGLHNIGQHSLNSMRLDEFIAFVYGGTKGGCHALDGRALEDCLSSAVKDLREFANEFVRGDFRPFLRVLALKHREERDAARAKQELSKQIYLA